MPRKKQKKRGREQPRPRPTFLARYGVGNQVRVKPGTTVPDFEDIPLGGWAGTINEIDQRSNPPTYRIEWNKHTLDHMHPVYRKRCERDGLEWESTWLGEADIEPDDGSPAVIEQPTNIVTRPLSRDDQDDRIRSIFGLTSDDPLPPANLENLGRYGRHLETHLSFPFQAKYSVETGPFQQTTHLVNVVGLLDADDCDEEDGLLCATDHLDEADEMPLTEIEVTIDLHNRQLIEDYTSWFVNARSEEDEDEEEEKDGALRPWFPTTPLASPKAPPTRWGVVKTIVKCVVGGALCGAVLGSLLAAAEIAGIAMAVGAGILGFIGCTAGANYGRIFGAVNRITFGPLLVGTLGAIGGAVVGAILGAVTVAFLAVVSGGIVGGFVGKQLSGLKWQPIGTFRGVLIGVGVGAGVQAYFWDQEKALTGAMVGAGVGAVLAPLLFLAAIGALALVGRRVDR